MNPRRSFEEMGRELDELWREQKEKQMEESLDNLDDIRIAHLKYPEHFESDKQEELMTGAQALGWMWKRKDQRDWQRQVLDCEGKWWRISKRGVLQYSMDKGETWSSNHEVSITNFLNADYPFVPVRSEEWFDYEPKQEPAQAQPLPDELSLDALYALWFGQEKHASWPDTAHELAQRILRQVARMIAASKEGE